LLDGGIQYNGSTIKFSQLPGLGVAKLKG
jgi:hypothetical protein